MDLRAQALKHEPHEMFPTIKGDIQHQGAQMLEESVAGRQQATHSAVGRVHPVERGMKQVSEQNQGGQQIGQVLFAMPEVMLKMIALIFEHIIVFVLNFLTGTPRGGYVGDIAVVNLMRGRPGILIDSLSLVIGESQFAPIEHQRVVAVAQRQSVHVAVTLGQTVLARFADRLDNAYRSGALEVSSPFIEQ